MYFTSGAEPSSHQTRLPENPESGGKAVSLPGANHPSLRPPPTRSGKLTINDITKFFSLPIAEAASILGVSDSVLKRICRENGIVRWPYRKFLAGKNVEIINKDGTREKTKEVHELSKLAKDKVHVSTLSTSTTATSLAETFSSDIDNKAPGLVQDTKKLQKGVHMSGQVFHKQGNKFVQYGWSGIPQPLQPKNISTYMDEFEYGFPSNGLSSVSTKWWIDSSGEDSRMLQGQSMDNNLDKEETSLASNETNYNYMMDEETESSLEERAILNEPSASLCFLRKRSAEYGQEALEDRISKHCDSSRLTKRQRLLLSQVFNAPLPGQSKDTLSNL
ncbi:uncharacterized protein LOC110101214 [Dendrobium catenatum]|nr:uncharacterized protein LOC110101214 [Dendrobium catenatum]